MISCQTIMSPQYGLTYPTRPRQNPPGLKMTPSGLHKVPPGPTSLLGYFKGLVQSGGQFRKRSNVPHQTPPGLKMTPPGLHKVPPGPTSLVGYFKGRCSLVDNFKKVNQTPPDPTRP